MIGWLESVTYYTAFTEGWALYAENPLIAEDTDAYKNEPMQKFGMLKWQVRRHSASLSCCLPTSYMCYVTLCCVTLCYVLLSYVKLCHVMLRYVT